MVTWPLAVYSSILLSEQSPLLVCLCVRVCNETVCFLLCRGGWMLNKHPLVSGCRANIDLSVLQHIAGQIKHSSNSESW